MDFSFALKVLGGLGAVSVSGVGIAYLATDGFNFPKHSTKWDDALKKKLEGDSDFNFEVKKIVSSTESDVDNNSFSFSGNSPIEIIARASITDSSLSDLKNMNNNADWKWECKIKLNKTGTNTQLEKDKLFKDSNPKGLLNKLKEANNKELKKKFITKCAKARTSAINKQMDQLPNLSNVTNITNQENNKIKSIKEFDVINGTASGETDKLVIKDFDSWLN